MMFKKRQNSALSVESHYERMANSVYDGLLQDAQNYNEAVRVMENAIKENAARIESYTPNGPAYKITVSCRGLFVPSVLSVTDLLSDMLGHVLRMAIIPTAEHIAEWSKIIETYKPIGQDGGYLNIEDAERAIQNHARAGTVVAEYDYPPLTRRTDRVS